MSAAAEFVHVADRDDVPPGGMRAVTLDGARVVIADVGGTLHAFADDCSHDGGPLSEGELAGGVVTCPWHFSRFCVRSGSVVESPAEEPIRVYELELDGGAILLRRPG